MNKKYFFWVSDCYTNTGEGQLALNFIQKVIKIKKIDPEIKTYNFKASNYKQFRNKILKHNYNKSNFSFFLDI